jgi:ribose 1,5-bisphosphate isomerase
MGIMLEETLKDIKELKIQGAENVAKAAVNAISEILETSIFDQKKIYQDLVIARQKLEAARSTEPCLRNAMTLLFIGVNENNVKEEMRKNILKAKDHFITTNSLIAEFGSRKIKEGMVVFTHCHSSAVIDILKEAKRKKINFSVKNTETRPLYQGRKTASELSAEGIQVEHFIDSAGRLAVKKSDIMLIGADALTSEGYVINKIGSELFAETAHTKGVPVYICTDSWKFDVNSIFGYDEAIEKRHAEEIWKDSPKGVRISNYAFESINPELITGIISELGVYNVETFIGEIKRNYPWLFDSRKSKNLLGK